jgi:hypothetical protein
LPNNQASPSALGKNEAPVIRKNAVYNLDQARDTLRLARATLGREIRLGRLRVAKRAGKYLILGSWLLEWIKAGELRRHRAQLEVESDRVPANFSACGKDVPKA